MIRKCMILATLFIAICTAEVATHSPKINLEDKLTPEHFIRANGTINSLYSLDNILYISTLNGKVEIWDLAKRAKIGEISLDNIVDINHKSVKPKVFFSHTLDNKKILIVSKSSIVGKMNISIYSDGKLKAIDLGDTAKMIKSAFFVNDEEILISVDSYAILLYNIKSEKIVWYLEPEFEVFTDLVVNGDVALSSTEGGKIYMINLKNGEILQYLQGANFDKIISLASAKNIAITAGRDKYCGIYNIKNGDFHRIKADFFINAAAISADSTLGAIIYNIKRDVLVFDTKTLEAIAIIDGTYVAQDWTNGQIRFLDNNTIATFSNKDIRVAKIR